MANISFRIHPYLLLFLLSLTVQFATAQCNDIIDPAKDCQFMFTLEGNFLADNFCSRLPDSNPIPELIPFCNGASTSENTGLFNIVPITPALTLRITPINCSTITIPGQGSFSGLQAAIFENCNFDNFIDCAPTCHTNAFEIGSEDFIPNQEYILAFDGCNGSICDFKIEIVKGQVSELIPLVNPILISPNSICSNELIQLQVEGLPLLTTGEWTIEGNTDFDILFNGKAIQVNNWGSIGNKEICATINSSQDGETYFDSCWTVTVNAAPIILDIIPDAEVCPGDEISLNFNGENFNTINWIGDGLSCSACPEPEFTMGNDTASIELILENDQGCEVRRMIQFTPSNDPGCLSAINEVDPSWGLEIGPNPFFDFINIQANRELNFSLYSIEGKIIWEKNAESLLRVSTGDLESGIYLLKAYNNKGLYTFKLLKR